MKFVPETLKVKQGDAVVWTNKDFFPHTATADGEVFDSGNIDSQRQWQYVAKKPGEYVYSCKLHPTMKATLVVQ